MESEFSGRLEVWLRDVCLSGTVGSLAIVPCIAEEMSIGMSGRRELAERLKAALDIRDRRWRVVRTFRDCFVGASRRRDVRGEMGREDVRDEGENRPM